MPKKLWTPPNDTTDDREYTPITNLNALYKSMGEMSRLIRGQEGYVAKIPDIERKAEASRKTAVLMRDEIVAIRTRQDDAADRLVRIEKNGHSCVVKPIVMPRLERLERFVEVQAGRQEEDTRTRVKVTTIETALVKAEHEKKALSRTVIAIMTTVILTALCSAGSSIWYIRGLQADLQLESQVSEGRDKMINQQLKTLPTSKQIDARLPTQQDVKTLAQAAEQKTRSADANDADQFVIMTPRQRVEWCKLRQDDLPDVLRVACGR